MNNDKVLGLASSSLIWTMRLLAMLSLIMCSWSAEATAPRVTAQMLGEEKKADIVGYQSIPLNATATDLDGKLSLEIVTESFKASGKTPIVDILPSKELAKYALLNSDAVALIGSQGDLTAKEKNQYDIITFYLFPIASGEQQFSIIFRKMDVHAKELQKAFSDGLKKIIKTGKYLELFEKYHGKGKLSTDYASRLKHYNPSWK